MFKHRKTFVWGHEVQLLWPDADTECFQGILEDLNMFYPTVIERCTQRRTVIQAGGNCGMYPMAYSLVFDKVFTFEPDQYNFYCLANNVPAGKIVKFNAAISSKPGFLRLNYQRPHNVGMHQISENGKDSIFAMTIDSLKIDDVDFINLDLEGHELQALLGAKETIERCKPLLCIELTEDKKEIVELIESLGYIEVATFKADHVYVCSL